MTGKIVCGVTSTAISSSIKRPLIHRLHICIQASAYHSIRVCHARRSVVVGLETAMPHKELGHIVTRNLVMSRHAQLHTPAGISYFVHAQLVISFSHPCCRQPRTLIFVTILLVFSTPSVFGATVVSTDHVPNQVCWNNVYHFQDRSSGHCSAVTYTLKAVVRWVYEQYRCLWWYYHN